MRAVVQRVARGSVSVVGEVAAKEPTTPEISGAIGPGLVVLIGVGREDSREDAVYLAEKVANLRIFEDGTGKMNRSALDLGLAVLAVSQFTLYGDCRNGRRPSFTAAAPPELGETLYEAFCREIEKLGLPVATGRFRSHMMVEISNDGPVTILLDSQKIF